MVTGQYYTDTERVYHDGITAMAQSGRRKVRTGCAVTAQTVPDMTVNVSSGTVYFGDTLVGVNEEANLVVPASNPTYNRYDIVVVNSSGVVSLLSGTPKSENDGYGPVPPAFDAETYLVLARITVSNGVSSITDTYIKDLRAIGSASGSGGGIGSYNVTVTDSTSTLVVHNLNDPIPDVACWTYNTSPVEIVIPASVQYVDDNNLFVEFDTTSDVRISVHGGVFNSVNVTQARTEVTVTNETSVIHTHSFAVKPVVQFIDSNGVVQNSGFTVDHISDNTIDVEFSPSTSGTLVLVGGAYGEIKSTIRQQIQAVKPDETYAPDTDQVGPISTIDFNAGVTSGVLFGYVPPLNIDITQDVEIEMQYFMDGSNAGTVNMQLDINQYSDAATATSAITTSLIETVTVPTTGYEVDIHKFSTIKIPSTYISTTKITCFELFRSNSDSNTENLKLINIDLLYKNI